MPISLIDRLAQIDADLQASSRTEVIDTERLAISLTESVNPSAGRGFDWIFAQAARAAKFIHHEKSADFTVFVFDDRSVLVLLSSGHVFASASGDAKGMQKISAWLKRHNIASSASESPRAANESFDPSDM